MSNSRFAFFLTIIAGASTLLGTIPIFIKFKNQNKIISGALAFASGVMVCVSVTDLIPESIHMLSNFSGVVTVVLCFFFLIIGIVFSSFVDKTLSGGSHDSLYRVGLISMTAIIIHNIPEGIATFISTTKDVSLGIALTLAIALHNIPEGISISVPIYYSTGSKLKALGYTLVSALSEPLGAVITYLFLAPFINNTILGLLFASIAGIMIQISITELLPTSASYHYKGITKIFFGIGIFFMLLKFFF